jgi:hypothetical protein
VEKLNRGQWLVGLFIVWLSLACPLCAQVANNTSLVGTVIDASGNIVTNAKVTAVNEETNEANTGITNGDGYYAILFIPVGTYDLMLNQPGFAKVTQHGIVVELNQAVRTDIKLEVGSVVESINISASTPAIPTDDATITETLNARSISDLPLNGRDAMRLATTSSNVILGPKSSMTQVPPGEDFIGSGQREITNSLTLDGITIMNNLITVSAVTPNLDAIQEVQVQNGNYTAQYGSYMGVHVNMATKSGTNNVHGSVFEFVRNDVLDAHPFFDPAGTPKQPLRFNQFGFALGGPVYLPKLYNGRNKTFFVASYEGLRQIRSGTAESPTLSSAMRQGDFSALSTPIYDPYTNLPFPNNVIPSSMLSPQAQAILQYIPLPNVAGTTTYNGPVASNISTNQTLERVDQNFGEKIRLFARYDWQNMTVFGGSTPPNPTSGTYGPMNNRNIAFGYTHVITPNLVNDFRFGRNHLVTNALNYFSVNGLNDAGTKLGIPGFNADTLYNDPGIPDVNIGGDLGGGYLGAGNAGSNWLQDDTTWHGYDQISYTRGKHNMMAGVELRKLTTGRAAANSPRGVFTFTGQLTQCVNPTSNPNYCPAGTTGDSGADFILGLPQNDVTPLQEFKGVVAEWRDGFFALDNWQVTRKLTLNYGLRYELPTVPYSVNGYGRILNSDQTALIPAVVPSPGFQFVRPNHDNWAPRLGFAYRATEKMVVRGGAGAYYNPNQMNSFTLATTNPPFGISTTYATTAGNPTITLADPTPGALAGAPSAYINVFREDPYLPTPRMYQWNLGVAQETWKNSGFELQYLGSHSLHLDRSFYNNQPNPGPGDVNARRPNQLWGRIRTIENDEIANYNGLTAVFRQRMSHGLQLLASYTWSHTLDVSSDSNDGGAPMNPYNWRGDYGNANWDIRHRFVASFVYDLPTLNGRSALLRAVLGNWQVNDITTLQTGMPFNVTIPDDVANIGRGNQRPNVVGVPHANCNSSRLTNCIDAAAFAEPAAYTFGNAARNLLYGPGLLNTDVSLFKNFPINERAKFEFRAEFFNVFNHPLLSNPNSTLNDPSFGSITSTVGTGADNRDIQFGAKLVF